MEGTTREDVPFADTAAYTSAPALDGKTVLTRRCLRCVRDYADDARLCERGHVLHERFPADPLIGTVLVGRYRLCAQLGEGAFGQVYLAENVALDGTPCVVKVLKPEILERNTREFKRRFERERTAMARLWQSDAFARILDFQSEQIDGVAAPLWFIVMDYVSGSTLKEVIERDAPFPPVEAVRIARDIARGLSHAHAQGVLHRDLKPTNIMLQGEGPRYRVKLIDLGIARLLTDDPQATTTQQGVFIGTPLYASPEQHEGRRIDGRADLYALGCVAYWMVTGRRVFERDTAMKILLAHAHEAPEPPSRHAPGPLPEALEALVLRCLEKPREARPQSVAELEAGLHTVPLAEAWTAEEATRWWAAQERGAGTGVADAIADTVAFGAG